MKPINIIAGCACLACLALSYKTVSLCKQVDKLTTTVEAQRTDVNFMDCYAGIQKEPLAALTYAKNIQVVIQPVSTQTVAINYSAAAVPTFNLPLSEDLQTFTYHVCNYYGIEDKYELILAQMWQESNYDESAISSTDDYGLMQINKINHEELSRCLLVDDFLDPEQNIHAGIYIMSNLLDRYNGDINKALMAYNLGPSGATALWENNIYSTTYSRGVLEKLNNLNSYYESN